MTHPICLVCPRPGALRAGVVLASLSLLAACAPSASQLALGAESSQVQVRSIQQRWFDTADNALVLRATIATLQDLGFIVDKADADLGTVSATNIGGADAWTGQTLVLKITVTVRTLQGARSLVRANLQYGLNPVDDPQPYQDFFRSLSKGLFLEAHALD